MAVRSYSAALAVLSLVGLGIAAPMHALAQDDVPANQNDAANKKIDLDLESTNLYYGLKLLFSQVKANFTIDESLKSLTVTAHLNQVPFRIALETLLKSTSTPLTYKIENGIYSVVPKVEMPDDKPTKDPDLGGEAPATHQYKYGIIRPNNVSAIDLAYALGGHIVNVGYNPGSYGTGGMGGIGGGGNGGIGGGGNGGIGGGGNGGIGGGSNFGGGGNNFSGGGNNLGGGGSQGGRGGF